MEQLASSSGRDSDFQYSHLTHSTGMSVATLLYTIVLQRILYGRTMYLGTGRKEPLMKKYKHRQEYNEKRSSAVCLVRDCLSDG